MSKPDTFPTFKRLGIRNIILVLGLMIGSVFSDTIGNDTPQSIRIKLPQGEVEGRARVTTRCLAFQEDPIEYFSFEGIPFGVPPIGKLRFKAPVPAGNWSGVYDATRLKPHCAQITETYNAFEGQEDCLFVNVYIRNLNPERLRPVFVTLHGGRFRSGGAEFHSSIDMILEINPVIVTFNYRLSVLGLLSLDTEEVPGNMQSKDQLLALKWVQKNIKYFGGDPDNVTLYGPSSGATSAYLLQMSPLSKGLFHKSILKSGACSCHWTFGCDPVQVAFNFTLFLGLNTTNPREALDYLTKQPVERLVRGVFDFENQNAVEIFKFAPVLEKSYKNGTAFLPRTPHAAYETGEFNDVPTIISYTSKEFAFYVDGDNLQSFISRADDLLPLNWKIPIHSKLFNETLFRIKQFYFGGQQIDLTDHDAMENCLELLGDNRFINHVIEVAHTHVAFAKSPLYLYKFSYRGGLNHPNIDRLGIQGACHSDEREYIFPQTDKKVSLKSSDNFVRRRHLMIYKNFMETSNPTPVYSNLLPEKWPPYTSDKKEFLHVGGDAVVCLNPDKKKSQFWTDLEEYVIKEGGFDRDWKKHSCIMNK